jgi:glycosyltransferase involved in cell wall biosynthesis
VTAPVPEVSIVVPLYNEEDNVVPLCSAIRSALEGWPRTWEAVLVDDGSRDRTRELLRRELEQDPRFRIVFLRRNSGQTAAMGTGFARSRGRIIVSMDGDLQNDPKDIPFVVERIDAGWDVVCGWRKDRKDKWLSRKFPSKIANKIIAWMTGVPIHDNGCSLKAYRAEVIRSLRLYSDMHRFLPALSSMTGAKIDEVVVRHHARRHGESKYGISRTFKVLADMVTIKMVTQFGTRPGVWFAAISLPAVVLGVGTVALWLAMLERSGARATIVLPSVAAMLFYLAGHLLTLSVFGELLLARADRSFLKRFVEVLTIAVRDSRPTPGRSAR